jgi:hypothetical protein
MEVLKTTNPLPPIRHGFSAAAGFGRAIWTWLGPLNGHSVGLMAPQVARQAVVPCRGRA